MVNIVSKVTGNVKIYFYEVTWSGDVIPETVRSAANKETLVIWQVKFPEFRSTLDTKEKVYDRFKDDIDDFVTSLEEESMSIYPQNMYDEKAKKYVTRYTSVFSYAKESPLTARIIASPQFTELPVEVRKDILKRRTVRISVRPSFNILDRSVEYLKDPATGINVSIDVKEKDIPAKKAKDIFHMFVIRPDGKELFSWDKSPISSKRWEHDLE